MNFFACKTDLLNILQFILTETDLKIYEHHSEYEGKLREFSFVEEIVRVFNIGFDKNGTGFSTNFILYSPSFQGKLVTEKITFDPKFQIQTGHSYRYKISGWGLINMGLGGIYQKIITPSYIGHNTEKRARKWEDIYSKDLGSVDAWDWKAMAKIFAKIQNYIRRMHVTVTDIEGRFVLPEAYEKYQKGYLLKE